MKTYDYKVLLSYPIYDRPNRIEYTDESGEWIEVSNGLGERLGPEEAKLQVTITVFVVRVASLLFHRKPYFGCKNP